MTRNKIRKVYARYVGDGRYIHGVPARNLTKEEYEKHRAAIERTVGPGLYEVNAPVTTQETDNATG